MEVTLKNSKERLLHLLEQFKTELSLTKTLAKIEDTYKQHSGKKSVLVNISKSVQKLPENDRRNLGQEINKVRTEIDNLYHKKLADYQKNEIEERIQKEKYDSLRPLIFKKGTLHPITQTQYKVEKVFNAMGFQIVDGPELEDDKYNFEHLNFSEDHPARDMQDTIWTTNGKLMRTHTSAVQARALEELEPPFSVIAPGRCFRHEDTDASHENTFHQVEGMMVGKDISVANLIYVMKSFLSVIFERDIIIRLRPGYFPFVEPGFELDIACLLCDGKGCHACNFDCWVELLPCGLIHPKVLAIAGINPKQWSGFAFGLGLDRLVMMDYKIEDIRHFLSGNLRFLNQF